MGDEIFSIRLPEVKRDLHIGIVECNARGLAQSAKWLAEMNHGLSDIELPENFNQKFTNGISEKDYDNYYLGKSYFDVREFDRAAYFTRNCESPVPQFLHFYAMYMAKEKKRLDSTTDNSNLNDNGHINDLSDLLAQLKSLYGQRKLDGYCLYLYGLVLKKLDLEQIAFNVLLEAVHATPTFWAAWVELAPLIGDKERLQNLNLPNHWMRHMFWGYALIELYLNDEGLKHYEELQSAGFHKCLHVTSQIAIAYHNKRDVDKAIEIFQLLQEADPYRLDNLDTYSNLLFVKELKTDMAFLAHKAVEINKYRPETCCVIGNYYSIRGDHQKAIVYFQRALKLDPRYLAAWTLMGHEFMELKNINAAIQSYRKAVEVNRRDYRAWYGLGQAYEILKMNFYSLYYFKIAHTLRPYDSRMLVALAETYERLDKNSNAIKCYEKACNVGDIEGIALFKLANLYEKLGDLEKAVPSYVEFCMDERATSDKQSLYQAYITLANYYESKGNYEEASHYAYKCLESDEKKSEAKSLLKTIENRRAMRTTTPQAATVPTVVAEDADCQEVWMDESDMVVENSPVEGGSETERVQAPAERLAVDNADSQAEAIDELDMSIISMD